MPDYDRMRRPLRMLAAVGAAGAALGATVGASLWGGRRRPGEPPLVRTAIPLLGSALPFSRNATAFLQQCRRDHGEVFTVYAAGKRMTFVCDPLSYQGVLRSPALQFEPIADQVMARAFDFPNMRSAVDLQRLDASARTYLKGAHLAQISDAMCREVHGWVHAGGGGRLRGTQGTFGLYRAIWDLIFAAGTEVIFGRGKACPQAARAFEDFDRHFPALVAGLPKFMARQGVAGLRALTAPFADLGVEPSAWLRDRQTLMEDLDVQRRGRAQAAALWAVHANTIPAVFWTLAHLLSDPVATQAVCDEIAREVRGGVDAPLGVQDLDRLASLHSAAREALRIATGSMTVRRATENLTVQTRAGDFAVRAGDQVCLAPQLTHHDPAVFDAPERYRYDRFLDRGDGRPQFEMAGERAGFAFLPFGAGKHTCPGRFFAVNEVKIVVATLLRAVAFEPVTAALPAFDYSRIGLGVFPPRDDLTVRWRRRAPPAGAAAHGNLV